MKEPWRMGRGVWAMVVAVTMFMRGVRGGVSDYQPGWSFNGAEHDALCDVFQASLDLWNASRKSNLKLGGGLENALGQAIFGSTSGGNIEGLKDTLPQEYKNPERRQYRCGSCNHHKETYPGKSIPHDLMCLCTPGKYGEPFYGYWFFQLVFEDTGFKLCGKERKDMVNNHHDGWYEDEKKREARGLEKPWKTVVMGCVNSWKKNGGAVNQTLEEKLKTLIEAMTNFGTELFKDGNRWDKLGGMKEHHTESDGRDEKSIHVRYRLCQKKKKPWWRKLQEVLGKPQIQLLVDPSAVTHAKEPGQDLEEGEEILEEPGERNMDSGGGTSSQAGSSTQGGSDGNATQTQGFNNGSNSTVGMTNTSASENSTSTRFGMLRSGTPITPPTSRFLSAVFFI
ncbi:Variant surface glycoprotein [Trypanosoma congolense IL3000]|uniref:Variant surface glycoprotein n=1 Tax=Trypanosoma congolense (strain IL3000) TaxID=1068625 RepID=F9WCR0_TRYCI|nr:Variant surface glycoprotein [Trypanosoma congolense IL3000]